MARQRESQVSLSQSYRRRKHSQAPVSHTYRGTDIGAILLRADSFYTLFELTSSRNRNAFVEKLYTEIVSGSEVIRVYDNINLRPETIQRIEEAKDKLQRGEVPNLSTLLDDLDDS